MSDWLDLSLGEAPLVVAFPHTGTEIPADVQTGFVSPWIARKDADWWVDKLYAFAGGLGATTLRTAISRTVIDVNRDPSGASLYPGQPTTELCPNTTFDDEALYLQGRAPDGDEIARRLALWHAPYHAALEAQLARLLARSKRVVLFDAHSIRSRIPRLFEGELPQFNIGTYDGRSCSAGLTAGVQSICAASGQSFVTNGRFKGGWTTRRWGDPGRGVHAIQLELACRGYMAEPQTPSTDNWPSPFEEAAAATLRLTLVAILEACLAFARSEG